MSKQFILVRGIQGSGKTYWSKKWAGEDSENRIRLNYDDIRNMLGKYWVPNRENLVRSIFVKALSSAMNFEYNIVIDNMSNLNPKHQEEYKYLISDWNKSHEEQYSLEFKDFKTPIEVCIERDSQRENPIGEKVIRQTYERYLSFYE